MQLNIRVDNIKFCIFVSCYCAVCVHGTYRKNLESILEHGLKRMNRLHVHFSCGLPTEGEVVSGKTFDGFLWCIGFGVHDFFRRKTIVLGGCPCHKTCLIFSAHKLYGKDRSEGAEFCLSSISWGLEYWPVHLARQNGSGRWKFIDGKYMSQIKVAYSRWYVHGAWSMGELIWCI